MAKPTSDARLSTPSHAALHNNIVDVRMFQAQGDGSTDDTSAIAAAVSAADAGSTLWFPRTSSYFKVTDAITVDKALKIAGPGEIRQTTVAKGLFAVSASNVHIDGLTLTGANASTFHASEKCVAFNGTSAAAPLVGVSVRNCKVRDFGYGGIYAKWIEDFEFNFNDIASQGFIGIQVLSALRGAIHGNILRDFAPGTSSNAYGIHLTRAETSSLSTDPLTADVSVVGNIIKDIAIWTGIDTHGGQRITIADNTIRNAKIGIAVGSVDNGSGTPTWAPKQVSVVGNTIESEVTDGTYGDGISFTGAAGSVGTPTDLATGSIVGNTIKGYGTQSSSLSGGILVRDTDGLTIVGNHIYRPSPAGINLYHDNYGVVVSSNTVVDPWSDTVGVGAGFGVRISSTHQDGIIAGNAWRDGDLAGKTFIMTRGISVSGATDIDITIGTNFSEASAFDILDSNSLTTAKDYTVTNLTTDRALDCNADDDLATADVLGTLIGDLQALGLFR